MAPPHPVIWNDVFYITIQEHLSKQSRKKLHRRERPALVAMRRQDGTELWRIPLPDTPQFFGAIIARDDLVCVGLSHGCIVARAHDGTPLWQWVNHTRSSFHFFAVENGVCYLGGGVRTWRMGAPFSLPPDLESFQQLSYQERARLHLLMSEQQSHHLAILIALRLTEGTCLWQHLFECEQQACLGLVSAMASGKRVFLTLPRGQHSQSMTTWRTDLIAVLSENGLPLWQKWVSDTACGEPLIMNDILYLGADDGSVYAFRIDTGDLLWRIPITVS